MSEPIIESGELPFSVEARLLRELGERLVRRSETALIELIKNSYDADAKQCQVARHRDRLVVLDDGRGMTFDDFAKAWMRIGTASKATVSRSPIYHREITGEKGIGRFSVRFLGDALDLETVAEDKDRGVRTRLSATFDWPAYDASEDIGNVAVPFQLRAVPPGVPTGTRLTIRRLRPAAAEINENQVRTASIGLVSPLRSLMVTSPQSDSGADPGFRLVLGEDSEREDSDIAVPILDAYAIRVRMTARRRKLSLKVFSAESKRPEFELTDTVTGSYGELEADIRFFPRRAGMFRDLGVDGRVAYSWIRENSGVAVFDRSFRVSPYGEQGDDWLALAQDAARNNRHPRSSMAAKHFPMQDAEQSSTADNWMLRLPQSAQLVGVVQVAGNRSDAGGRGGGLVAAADREGFLANEAFSELQDHVRGAVEAIAMVDRRLQRRHDEAARQRRLRSLKSEAAEAARAIEENPNLPAAEKKRIVQAIVSMADDAVEYESATRERIRQLETMSLLGVVAGFMTHEFGVALDELDTAHQVLVKAVSSAGDVDVDLSRFELARKRLGEFTDYSTAYIRGSARLPTKAYPSLPRVQHVCKTFAGYAKDRGVKIETDIQKNLPAPAVPTSLYDGIILNLFTNALKAVTGAGEPKVPHRISFRAWNEKDSHYLEVVDTGVGIPEVLWDRVFDPLFTTTDSRNDPLGSGMGLGLSLVRASAEAFGGKVKLVDPPPGFSTCVRVQFPLKIQEGTT